MVLAENDEVPEPKLLYTAQNSWDAAVRPVISDTALARTGSFCKHSVRIRSEAEAGVAVHL